MPSRTVFDGRSLTLYRSDGSIVGSWPAISGKNGDQRPSSQNLPFEGPLTEGRYSFSTGNVQPMTTLDATKGVVRRGLFPGSLPAWGTERVQLVPDSNPTNGRGNFFIHGGLAPGSAGCIDLGPNERAYFDAVRSTGESSHEVIVRYDPSLETFPHPLASRTPRSFVNRFGRWGTSPAGGTPPSASDDTASLDQRFENWSTTYANGEGATNLPPVAASRFVGPNFPFVSRPNGSLAASGGSSLLDPAPMDIRPGLFSTGGEFVEHSSPTRPLYPVGSFVPQSIRRTNDRRGLLDDRAGGSRLLTEGADGIRSPVLRELETYRQLAAATVDVAPLSGASSPGSLRVSNGVDREIGNGALSSAQVSPSNPGPAEREYRARGASRETQGTGIALLDEYIRHLNRDYAR